MKNKKGQQITVSTALFVIAIIPIVVFAFGSTMYKAGELEQDDKAELKKAELKKAEWEKKIETLESKFNKGVNTINWYYTENDNKEINTIWDKDVLVGLNLNIDNFSLLKIEGDSMSPYLVQGDKVICDKDLYKYKPFKPGMVVNYNSQKEGLMVSSVLHRIITCYDQLGYCIVKGDNEYEEETIQISSINCVEVVRIK